MIRLAIRLEGDEHGWREEWLPAVPRIGDTLWYDELWEELGAIAWTVTEVRWYPNDTDRDGQIEILALKSNNA